MGFADSFYKTYMMIKDNQRREDENKRKQELYSLIQPYIDSAKNDLKTTVEENPNYSFDQNIDSAIKANRLGMSQEAYNQLKQDAAGSTGSLKNDNSQPYSFSDGSGIYAKPTNQTPLTYKQGMNPNSAEFIARNPIALSLAGIKPDAIRMAQLTPEQQRKSAEIYAKLAQSADQEVRNKTYEDATKGKTKNDAIRTLLEGTRTLGDEGTENNNVVQILTEALQGAGIKTQPQFGQQAGRKNTLNEARINNTNARTAKTQSSDGGSGRSGRVAKPGTQFKMDQDWESIKSYIANASNKEEYLERLKNYANTLQAFEDAGYDVENELKYWNNQWKMNNTGSGNVNNQAGIRALK